MSLHLQREVEKLKKRIIDLACVVRKRVEEAVSAVGGCDGDLARRIIAGDKDIDQIEVDIEEDCLKLLALHQPMATDLRFIVAILKINNDIERVGDLAANIAERALALSNQPSAELAADLVEISTKALAMLSGSLDALIRLDAGRAREVRSLDNEVDALNRRMHAKVSAAVRAAPDQVDRLLSHLSVSRYLERIADYATNIAEDVIYLVDGEIARHKPVLPA